MIMLSRRCQLAVMAVIDIALHARPDPVSLKQIAARHGLPPRHLEALLQTLVHAHLLKGQRGPKGGYSLARERRRMSIGDIVRAASETGQGDHESKTPLSKRLDTLVHPALTEASRVFLEHLDTLTIAELCEQYEKLEDKNGNKEIVNFTI
jgi:Rrf2 family transcriptional regulator, iron-sulfur cluster assembly transcription factor